MTTASCVECSYKAFQTSNRGDQHPIPAWVSDVPTSHSFLLFARDSLEVANCTSFNATGPLSLAYPPFSHCRHLFYCCEYTLERAFSLLEGCDLADPHFSTTSEHFLRNRRPVCTHTQTMRNRNTPSAGLLQQHSLGAQRKQKRGTAHRSQSPSNQARRADCLLSCWIFSPPHATPRCRFNQRNPINQSTHQYSKSLAFSRV